MRAVRLGPMVLMLVLLLACGAGDPGEPGSSSRRQFLSLGTAPPGGAFFPVGGAIAAAMNESAEESWTVTAEATKGSQENIRRLATGEIDLALANSAISYFAARGEAGWDKIYPIRTVMTLAPNVALFITRADSDVKQLADLKGRRVVIGPAGAGFEFFVRPLLAAHGLTYDDMTVLHSGQTGAVDMLADGSAAAAFLGGAIPTASITQASAGREIHFIPFDEAQLVELTETYLFFNPATIPAGTYRRQDADFNGLDVGSMHLITSTAADADLIYRVTKAIYEAREGIVKKHAAGRAINPKNVVRDTGTEFHPGAIRYYREIGIWPTAEN